MSPDFTPFPGFDQRLLGVVAHLVPAAEREDWRRGWQAELWHMHDRRRRRRMGTAAVADLSLGLIRDALWLRTDHMRRTLSGTAGWCLGSLLGLNLLSVLIAWVMMGDWRRDLAGSFLHSVAAAPLVLFVAFATASRRPMEQSGTRRRRLKRPLFLAVKMAQVLLLAWLLSAELWQPIGGSLPNTATVMQIFSFVLLALMGLRWALRDQELRCKQCLHLLTTPARVGRPSHNLLEWNGTELNCRRGHGLLSVPEMETSWCESSRWIESGWDQAASV